MRRWTGLLLAASIAICALTVTAATPAAADDEQDAAALADRYAPVLRLQQQTEDCGAGEPFEPIDVDLLMGNREVAFRGPWDQVNLIKPAPSAQDLSAGNVGYHLDFPGDALDPGCTYEEWADRITSGRQPTTYAHVVVDPDQPDRLALQYWFFYVYNDFNNKHEGDWEMIQLVFDAASPGQALAGQPQEVGYSQHEGAERAKWTDPKLEKVDGTHPVVYPAGGSHAGYFGSALHLGRTGAEGVGCDDTTAPHRSVRPQVAVVPIDRAAYLRTYPWLGFEGRWGELQESFFNGPTGPNTKPRWTEPMAYRESWRDDSFEVPLGGTIGPSVADFFCGGVETGSNLLRLVLRSPTAVLVGLLILLILVLTTTSRTRWSPADPFPLARRRAWGQVLGAAWRLYRQRPLLFLGLGVAYIPVMLAAAVVTWLLFDVTGIPTVPEAENEDDGFVAAAAVTIGGLFSILAYGCVLAAVAAAMAELEESGTTTLGHAYHAVRVRLADVSGAIARFLAVTAALSLLVVLTIPFAIHYVVSRTFAVPVVMIERRSAGDALRRSAELTRGSWWRTALVLLLVAGLGAVTGPLAGVALLLTTGMPLAGVNAVSALVYAITIPYVAAVLTYLYYDLAARQRQARRPASRPPGRREAPAGDVTTTG